MPAPSGTLPARERGLKQRNVGQIVSQHRLGALSESGPTYCIEKQISGNAGVPIGADRDPGNGQILVPFKPLISFDDGVHIRC